MNPILRAYDRSIRTEMEQAPDPDGQREKALRQAAEKLRVTAEKEGRPIAVRWDQITLRDEKIILRNESGSANREQVFSVESDDRLIDREKDRPEFHEERPRPAMKEALDEEDSPSP